MRVIGTAGHVDHGKSTLVERLSGINPDRLAEEQSRQMTIDLGFAWMRLPNGETVGIVDVPGHRDFIENMLAGVGGIDAALLVIAADEGIMPQTREHMAILKLLDVKQILVVISKLDLIDDPDWLELVKLDIDDLLLENQIFDTPIVAVSAHTGASMDVLVTAIQQQLNQAPERVDNGQPRLPVDRVFVVAGFGTVVTGTLSGGKLSLGDQVELQPSGGSGRIRGLQSYRQSVETVSPGSRVAANIAGISSDEIKRGDVLAFPGQLQPTFMADAHFKLLHDVERPLEHNAEVKLFSGAAESIANVRLLDTDTLQGDSEGWLQVRLRTALPLSRGDRFILRYPSPAETIGGGVIVNANPRGRRKRFQTETIEELQLRLTGTPAERLAIAAEGETPSYLKDLGNSLGYGDEELKLALRDALAQGLLKSIDASHVIAAASWQALANRALDILQTFHTQHPLRLGMLRAELRSRLNTKLELLDRLIDEDERIMADGNFVRWHDHRIQFSSDQSDRVDQLMQVLNSNAFTPPSIVEMNQLAGEAVVRALLDMQRLINVNDKIAFARDDYLRMVADIRRHIKDHDEIDAKTLRDKYGTSRKYAIAMLEHLDSLGITQRVGDMRKRGRNL